MFRYAIYTRQSVEKLADFSSCDAQFHTCRDFADAIGEPNRHWCGQRFDDEGQSGATLDRPAMQKLRKVIDLGGIDCLYAVAMDRLTRSMRHAVVLLDELAKANVELRLVHQPELGGGAQGRFLRHILAAFAEFERDMITTRLAESRAYLKKHGRRLAGKIPFGYDADPETRQLISNPTEAPQVAAIFERAARGELPKQIASDITELGWRTKVYHSKRSGKTTGGGKWTARQVIDTLRNPVHTGRFADGADIREGSHEPIVDQTVFDAAQKQLDARRTTKRGSRITHKDIPFRQKIVCPQCGRFLTTYQVTRNHSTAGRLIYSYYACRSTAGGRPRCKGVNIRAWDIEKEIYDILDTPETWRRLISQAETAQHVHETWQAMLWSWRRDWIQQCIERIEFANNDEIIITFNQAEIARFTKSIEQPPPTG